jgi:sugar fermentation stimulation protein A
MKIDHVIVKGRFVKRLNRFEAQIEVEGVEQRVHVPNTGRCKELFIEGVEVLLEKRDGKHRKTAFELIMVYKGNRLVSIDSQLPNKLAAEALQKGVIAELQGYDDIRREVTYGDSRFDLCLAKENQRTFVEVKGVTLESDGIVKFPDAPTERGTKHLYELIKAKQEGLGACILFVVQLDFASYFMPNSVTDPKFAEALKAAQAAGVQILAYSCEVQEQEVRLLHKMEVRL